MQMHISLVLLRLEVKDESPSPENFVYCAPHFKLPDDEPKDVTSKMCALYTGARKMQKIEIESIENIGTDEDSEAAVGGLDKVSQEDDKDSISFAQVVRGGIKSPDSPNTSDSDGAKGSVATNTPRDQFRPISTRNSPVVNEDGPSSRPGSARSRPVSHSPSSKLPASVPFLSGNPMVECTEGILHLYKLDNVMTPLSEDVPRSEMICMLAVPATMTTHDLMNFLAPVYPGVEHIRIIRDHTPNQYMVLVKFKNQKLADEFYGLYNNCPFNSFESDVCYLVYVAKVETLKSSRGAYLPVAGMTELPKCAICLARMEETVEGVLTILCNHTFHGLCLTQWGDTSCPVCRYCQTPEVSEDNKCNECDSTESLWICLICGHVGCGRYVVGHAFEHFKQTHHTYAMQLSNNRVWDYVGDNYVHRLIQTKGDGKLVEVDERGNMVQDEKIDSLTLEYTYLLTSQLESQRHYFEEKMEAIERNAKHEKESLESRSNELTDECAGLNTRLSEEVKQKLILEKRCQLMTAKLSKLSTELEEERTMNKCLRDNQREWQERVQKLEGKEEDKEREICDLREQLRDVMFYIEAQQEVAKADPGTREEIQHGHIVMGASGSDTKKTKKKR